MSWVGVAAAVGVGRGIYGAVNANQIKQRNKGTIGAAYRSADYRLGTQEAQVQDESAESLAARGLLNGGGGGTAIRASMKNGIPVTTGAGATDLGSQAQVNLGEQFALEQSDLSSAATRAQNENKAAGINAEISSIGSGIQDAISVYGMKKPPGISGAVAATAGAAAPATPGAGPPPMMAPPVDTMVPPSGPSAIRQVYSGIDDPSNTFGGIHPLDPLNHPTSTFNRNRVGVGQPNVSFNVGDG